MHGIIIGEEKTLKFKQLSTIILQVLGIIVVSLIMILVFRMYFKRKIILADFIVWEFFWALVGILVLAPALMTDIAKIFGVGRGVDAIIYFALFLLFYLIFKLSVRVEKLDQDITKVVKEIALKEKKRK